MIQFKFKKIILALGLSGLLGCSRNVSPEELIKTKRPFSQKIQAFDSCLSVGTYIASMPKQEIQTCYNNNESSTSPIGIQHENQVVGVEEGDQFRMDDNYYYFLHGQRIELVSRNSSEHSKTLSVSDSINSKQQGEILVLEKDLVYVGLNDMGTNIKVWDKNNNFNLKLKKQFEGKLLASRGLKDKLILTTVKYISDDQGNFNPNSLKSSSFTESNCTNVFLPPADSYSVLLTNAYAIDLNDLKETQVSFLGKIDFIYFDNSSFYLFTYFDTYNSTLSTSTTAIRKVSLDDFYDQRVISVPLRIDKRWYIQSMNDHFLVAGLSLDQATMYANFVIDLNFKQPNPIQGSSPAFGVGENIRAVRFDQDYVYVVTYKKTDPLFAFSLKEPGFLQIVDELKIPGFSTQLKKLNENTLVGLGFADSDQHDFAWAQGLKLSLFRVSEAQKLEELDNHIMGGRGSFSIATADPRAFRIDKNYILFPLSVFNWDSSYTGIDYLEHENEPFQDAPYLSFSGAAVYEVIANKFQLKKTITHQAFRTEQCGLNFKDESKFWSYLVESKDVQRVFIDRNKIYAFSRFGFSVESLEGPSQSRFTYFAKSDQCVEDRIYVQ